MIKGIRGFRQLFAQESKLDVSMVTFQIDALLAREFS